MIHKGSRYQKTEARTLTDATGREIRYRTIREIPPTKAYEEHIVQEGQRLDHIAFEHFRIPTRAWRILDANEAMWPDDLVAKPDDRLKIPPSEE